jgi:hypothetical protein
MRIETTTTMIFLKIEACLYSDRNMEVINQADESTIKILVPFAKLFKMIVLLEVEIKLNHAFHMVSVLIYSLPSFTRQEGCRYYYSLRWALWMYLGCFGFISSPISCHKRLNKSYLY